MPTLGNVIESYWLDGLLLDRAILRKQGKYQDADRIREELTKAHIKLIDVPEGTMWELEVK